MLGRTGFRVSEISFGAWAIGRGASRAVVLGRDSRVTGPLFHAFTKAALERVRANLKRYRAAVLRAAVEAGRVVVTPDP